MHYIALVIFEENMTNMIVFLHSKATNVMADKLNSEVKFYIQKGREALRNPQERTLKNDQYPDFLYVGQLLAGPNRSTKTVKQLVTSDEIKTIPICFSKKYQNLQRQPP